MPESAMLGQPKASPTMLRWAERGTKITESPIDESVVQDSQITHPRSQTRRRVSEFYAFELG